jgi:opacity protein-like surface antigen
MKNFSNKAIVAICAIGISFNSFAGNKDRTGQSGAPEMTINPWARSTGLFGLNIASVGGMEAMKSNIGGLAQDSTTEIGLSHGIYLSGSDISINNLAVAQKVGDAGVIGINIMSMSFGDIPTTDYYNPQGVGSYHPQFLNIEVGYAKQFSSHINAGFAVTYVSEQISNIGAQGVAFEGGIQYVTGKHDNFHFGIALRNLGTNMRFSGTGFSINGENPQNTVFGGTTNLYPSDKFDMPTYLTIGAQYDLFLDNDHLSSKNGMPMHRLSIIADFTSNSYNNDYTGAGLEYSFKNILMLRAAYRYENGIGNPATSTTMYMGAAFGATIQSRINGKGPMFAFDYSYRPTERPANGVHMLSLRFTRG